MYLEGAEHIEEPVPLHERPLPPLARLVRLPAAQRIPAQTTAFDSTFFMSQAEYEALY